MKEFVDKLIDKFTSEKELAKHSNIHRARAFSNAIYITNKIAERYVDGWIACSDRLPEKPNENPLFENKALELYLVTVKNAGYPIRAFWNGKYFTDGWSKVDVIAWQQLPGVYKPVGCADKECPYNTGEECPEAVGCAGYEQEEHEDA